MPETIFRKLVGRKTVKFSVTEQSDDGEKLLQDDELLTLTFSKTSSNVFLLKAEKSGHGSGTIDVHGNLAILEGTFDFGDGHTHDMTGVIYPTRKGEKAKGHPVSACLFINFLEYTGTDPHVVHQSGHAHTHPPK